MTRVEIEEILERVKTWPLSRQEDAAAIILEMENQGHMPYILSEEERKDLEEALEEVERGEMASEEEVAAFFNQYRRK